MVILEFICWVAFATAWLSTDSIGWLHKGAGYLASALVLARVVWGFCARNPHARFANFVPGPRRLWAYLSALVRRREPRHIGHNPAGATMIVFLLLAVTGIGVSGWMMTLDAFWGDERIETLHVRLVELTVAAVMVHVLANLYGSQRHRENLVASMITGLKPAQVDDGAGGERSSPTSCPSARRPWWHRASAHRR